VATGGGGRDPLAVWQAAARCRAILVDITVMKMAAKTSQVTIAISMFGDPARQDAMGTGGIRYSAVTT
jgi:hypothetical protein